MIRNKLYDELENQGYSFNRVGSKATGQFMPQVFSLTDPEDWATVNTAVVINGQYQVEHGVHCNDNTIRLLQRVINETSKPDYSDYYSKALFKGDE